MSEQATFNGEIDWYDGYYLEYDNESIHNAVNNLNLNVGDKVQITITKMK